MAKRIPSPTSAIIKELIVMGESFEFIVEKYQLTSEQLLAACKLYKKVRAQVHFGNKKESYYTEEEMVALNQGFPQYDLSELTGWEKEYFENNY